jgi:hypothetical protein
MNRARLGAVLPPGSGYHLHRAGTLQTLIDKSDPYTALLSAKRGISFKVGDASFFCQIAVEL